MLTTTASGRTYDYSHNVGGFTQTPSPVAVVCGPEDAVYVLSRQYEMAVGALTEFESGKSEATFAWIDRLNVGDEWGSEEHIGRIANYGYSNDQLIWPAGIVLDDQGNIFVSDEWMNRISKFSIDGKFISSWGSEGSDEGQLNKPCGIAIDSENNFWVVDSLNHRVQKFTLGGKFLMAFGSYGQRPGEMDSPWGIAIDQLDNLFIVDHKNHRVQKFDPQGNLLSVFGSYGSGPKGQLKRPSDVAVDTEGDVYICDWANNRVQIFQENGRFITSLIGDAQRMSMWHSQAISANEEVYRAMRRVESTELQWRFAGPTGVTYDAKRSRLMVADTHRSRVQIYNKLKDYMEPQFNL